MLAIEKNRSSMLRRLLLFAGFHLDLGEVLARMIVQDIIIG
jgi:hypothetical protein